MEPFLHTRPGYNASAAGGGGTPYTPHANAFITNQDFSNAAWGIAAGLTSRTKNAPDQNGLANTAVTFLFSAGTSARNVSGANIAGGNLFTHLGCFAKVGVAGCNFLRMSTNGGADKAVFDLGLGLVSSSSGSGTGSIVTAANGFYWCQVDFGGNEIQDPVWFFASSAALANAGSACTLGGTESLILYNPICY